MFTYTVQYTIYTLCITVYNIQVYIHTSVNIYSTAFPNKIIVQSSKDKNNTIMLSVMPERHTQKIEY